MNRKRLLLGSTGLAAAVAVGVGAIALTSGGASLASATVPTSNVASTSSAAVPNTTTKPASRLHWRMGRRGGAVYSETVIKQKSGGYKTIIEVRGSLTAISSSSISITRPDTGTIITAAITSTTRFGNTTAAALASDLSSDTAVTVRLVETANNAVSVSVPPLAGTRPKPGSGPFKGTFHTRSGVNQSSPASA
ncbi:MAG: hypothetical protein M1305_03395 [Candidatus Marsarchaeota archaeon]|nr:hypothetical protein [Candidatus Marsarchaeota archaeon]MDA8080248.1 hypothetical protein [Actinomycetota bacterium]